MSTEIIDVTETNIPETESGALDVTEASETTESEVLDVTEASEETEEETQYEFSNDSNNFEEIPSDHNGSDVVNTEVVYMSEQPDAAPLDTSFNVAVIFVLSMIVGLLVMSLLTRRWRS